MYFFFYSPSNIHSLFVKRHWLYYLTWHQMILGQKFGLLAMKMVGISIKTCQLLKPILEYWLISDISIAITLLMCWICLLKLNGISIPIPHSPFSFFDPHSSFPILIPHFQSPFPFSTPLPIPDSCLDIYIEITPQIFPIPHSPFSFPIPILNSNSHSPFPIPV